MLPYRVPIHDYAAGSKDARQYYSAPDDPCAPLISSPMCFSSTPPDSSRGLSLDRRNRTTWMHSQRQHPDRSSPEGVAPQVLGTGDTIKGVVEIREPSICANMGTAPFIPSAPSGYYARPPKNQSLSMPDWFAFRLPGPGPSAADEAHVSMLEDWYMQDTAGNVAGLGDGRGEMALHGLLGWQRSETRQEAELRAWRKVAKTMEKEDQREYIRLRGEEKAWVRTSKGKEGKRARMTRKGEVNDAEWIDEERMYGGSGRVRRERWVRCL